MKTKIKQKIYVRKGKIVFVFWRNDRIDSQTKTEIEIKIKFILNILITKILFQFVFRNGKWRKEKTKFMFFS